MSTDRRPAVHERCQVCLCVVCHARTGGPSCPSCHPSASKRPYVLLVEDSQGATLAVRFASREDAEAWEVAQGDRINVVGLVPLVSRKGALS